MASQLAWWWRIPWPMQETQELWVWYLGQEDPLEEGMATHFSILAWRIPWTEEPGGLQSIGLQSQTQLSTHRNKCIYLTVLLWGLKVIDVCKVLAIFIIIIIIIIIIISLSYSLLIFKSIL